MRAPVESFSRAFPISVERFYLLIWIVEATHLDITVAALANCIFCHLGLAMYRILMKLNETAQLMVAILLHPPMAFAS
jgi:hypothetical protein